VTDTAIAELVACGGLRDACQAVGTAPPQPLGVRAAVLAGVLPLDRLAERGVVEAPIDSTVGVVVDAIRSVLAELAPHDLVEFEAEFGCALAQADDDFDLAPVVGADRGQLREAHTGMDHRGGVTLLDLAAAVQAHRVQRPAAIR
jgi:hypothetical protein